MHTVSLVFWVCLIFVVGLSVATAYWMFAMRRPYYTCGECKGRRGAGSKSRKPWEATPVATNGCRKCGGRGQRARWSTWMLPKELR
jgi:hypothetical protein